MASRALGWKRAAAIAWRDLKSAPGKFAFVVLSVAVGVAALVGIRGFSEAFRSTLTTEARSLMAGDLSARIFREPTADEKKKALAAAQSNGVGRATWVVETLSMASVPPDPVPLLITLKAVDPAEYPYYGEAELEPQMTLQQALDGDSAVVADEFLIRLNAHVGQTLRLGGRNFKITAVLKQEPDRMSAGAGMGPRVMVSRAALDRTGLLAQGSRASQRLLLKLPAKGDPVAVRKQVETILPDAQVMDFKEGNPALSQGLDNATAILSLICLVAMVLGAIGVAMAMHAHLEQRMDMLAILKAVGARSSDLLRIFLLQTLGLGTGRWLDRRLCGRRRDGYAAGSLWQIAAGPHRARFSMAFCTRRSRNRFADHTSLLPAAVARCACSAARSRIAPAGRAGAARIRRMVRTLVGTPVAVGHFDPGDFCSWCNRVGAF